MSLAGLMAYASTKAFYKGIKSQRVSLSSVMSSNLVDNRERLLRGAVEHPTKPTHALFLDCDMIFAADLLHKLINRNLPIVGINYAAKILPSNPVAVAEDGMTHVPTKPTSVGVEKVGHTGFGAMLLDLSVIRNIPEPWFGMPWIAESKQPMAEDVFFCRQMRNLGIDIHIDHDASRGVYHEGMFRFGHEHVPGPVIKNNWGQASPFTKEV